MTGLDIIVLIVVGVAAIGGFMRGFVQEVLLLLLIPYAAMKLIAGRAGRHARNSVLGPIDRVLGFGFGAVKGVIIVVMAFSLLVLGYDAIWGIGGRPTWILEARTYPFINASSEALVHLIEQRRQLLREGEGG